MRSLRNLIHHSILRFSIALGLILCVNSLPIAVFEWNIVIAEINEERNVSIEEEEDLFTELNWLSSLNADHVELKTYLTLYTDSSVPSGNHGKVELPPPEFV